MPPCSSVVSAFRSASASNSIAIAAPPSPILPRNSTRHTASGHWATLKLWSTLNFSKGVSRCGRYQKNRPVPVTLGTSVPVPGSRSGNSGYNIVCIYTSACQCDVCQCVHASDCQYALSNVCQCVRASVLAWRVCLHVCASQCERENKSSREVCEKRNPDC